MTGVRHVLDVDDLAPEELTAVLDLSESPPPQGLLARRGVALLFEKPSARTRNAVEVAVAELGGHPVAMRGEEVGLDVRETVEDVARTLSLYHAAIGARVFAHATVERLAAAAAVPVVNLLSDRAHPCQALADLLTIRQRHGGLQGVTLAYVGDFNNVARSLTLAATMCGMRVRVGCPGGYGPSPADVERLRTAGAEPVVCGDPREAAAGADVVYTDVWTSMGQEAEAEARRGAFAGFTVDAAVMAAAAPGAVFMHCLPAHRGEEVAAEVIDGPQSAVWQQAANRLHTHRGLLRFLLEGADVQ